MPMSECMLCVLCAGYAEHVVCSSLCISRSFCYLMLCISFFFLFSFFVSWSLLFLEFSFFFALHISFCVSVWTTQGNCVAHCNRVHVIRKYARMTVTSFIQNRVVKNKHNGNIMWTARTATKCITVCTLHVYTVHCTVYTMYEQHCRCCCFCSFSTFFDQKSLKSFLDELLAHVITRKYYYPKCTIAHTYTEALHRAQLPSGVVQNQRQCIFGCVSPFTRNGSIFYRIWLFIVCWRAYRA